MSAQPASSVHAIVTDPPYGAREYSDTEQDKLAGNAGGLWRQPPSIGGHRRAPLPRFTTMSDADKQDQYDFFVDFGRECRRILAPGGHMLLAANPLHAHRIAAALESAGLEPRGAVVRLVQTLCGGDRPKGSEAAFADVSVMARSQWEPWVVMRAPMSEKTVAANLRRWGTGGLRRKADGKPFGDVIASAPTQPGERRLAPHPSLKPQAFLRQVVRASLPLGEGVVLDPFAGSGSTLAAACAVGYNSIGVERDPRWYEMARTGIPALAGLTPRG